MTRSTTLTAMLLCTALAQADDWPQWRGSRRDGVWREGGTIDKFAGPQVPIRWRAKISSGYSSPTIAQSRVYVSDRVAEPQQVERVHCFDAMSGKPLWSHSYPCVYQGIRYTAGPRAAITIHDGRAYSLGAVGHLFCFDAADGSVLWHKDMRVEYRVRMPGWGIAAAPLVEGELVIVQIGGRGACLVALDRKTGQERWRGLDDRCSYSAPIVVERQGRRVLICWTGDRVVGLDPATGTVLWAHPFPPLRAVDGIATPVVDGERLFLSGFYEGSLMLRLAPDGLSVQELWRRHGKNERLTDALHCLMSTPILDRGHIYGVDSYGELRCLLASTGERVWESLAATPKARWSNAHMVQQADRVWLLNERGELIISRLTPQGYHEISRAKLLDPTPVQFKGRGGVCWSHPAFAYKHVYARNDEELVCASLALPE